MTGFTSLKREDSKPRNGESDRLGRGGEGLHELHIGFRQSIGFWEKGDWAILKKLAGKEINTPRGEKSNEELTILIIGGGEKEEKSMNRPPSLLSEKIEMKIRPHYQRL